jgi:hypothetical protein
MTRAPTYRSETSSLRSVPSTRPPSYGRHLHDELLSAPQQPPSGRPSLTLTPIRVTPRRRSCHQPQVDYVSQMLQILTAPEPLTLTVDNNLLYPPPPSNALYHLPRILTWSGNEISLSRSLPVSARRGSLASVRDLALYTMRRTPFTHEIALLPRREGLKGGVMRGRRSLLGNLSWEVEVKGGDKLLRYSKGRWKTADGKVVAREKQKSAAEEKEGSEEEWQPVREEITIEGEDVELWMKDLIVAAWCCRIWQGNGRMSFTRTLMRGQGMFISAECGSGLIFVKPRADEASL